MALLGQFGPSPNRPRLGVKRTCSGHARIFRVWPAAEVTGFRGDQRRV